VVSLWASLEKVLKVQNIRRCIGFGLGEGYQNIKALKPDPTKILIPVVSFWASLDKVLIKA